jgi:hypothetical protein
MRDLSGLYSLTAALLKRDNLLLTLVPVVPGGLELFVTLRLDLDNREL